MRILALRQHRRPAGLRQLRRAHPEGAWRKTEAMWYPYGSGRARCLVFLRRLRVSPRIRIDHDRIAEFCRRWRVTEFSLFGSVLREDFRPRSDVDVLVSFSPDAPWHLMHLVEMREELEQIFGREVDLVEKRALRNPFRRHEILTTMQTLYAA